MDWSRKAEQDAASGLWDFGGGDLIKYPLCGMILKRH